jgi:hypothetical protein
MRDRAGVSAAQHIGVVPAKAANTRLRRAPAAAEPERNYADRKPIIDEASALLRSVPE